MAKIALYQKYRSSTFEEVVGQEYTVRAIKNAVRNGKVGHAYLFCGPRGTGKTTMARLLAKAVNCENPENAPCGACENCIAANNGTHPDIVEINAANETHVEDVRDLIERSTLAPMQGKHKIYIIDEVHQLSSAASSALLKTLEEPPENVIFVLATTDPQKLLPTIISRCQRFDFTKVRADQIRDHLLSVAEKENIYMEKEAAEQIAALADGGMRDALSIMDQCAAYTGDHITSEDINRIYGLSTRQEKIDFLKKIASHDLEGVILSIRQYEQNGLDILRFADGLTETLKDTAVFQKTHKASLLKILTVDEAGELAECIPPKTCMHMIEAFADAREKFRYAVSLASCFEVICLDLTVDGEEEEKPAKTAIPAGVQMRPVRPEGVKPLFEDTKKEEIPEKPEIPVKKEEEPKPEEPVTPEIPAEPEPEEPRGEDYLIRLLVQCSKSEKMVSEEALSKMDDFFDLSSRRYISLLKNTVIGASGKDCLILVTKQQAVANRINEPELNEELYFFLKDHLDLDKVAFAVTSDEFRNASVQFRALMNTDHLPEAVPVRRYKKEEVKEETPEDKVMALFGRENVDIIGG